MDDATYTLDFEKPLRELEKQLEGEALDLRDYLMGKEFVKT